MKKFRIVTDSFSGYEAQVQYAFFPFKWFQLNDYKGVNTWNTPEQALDFINQKKAGVHSKNALRATFFNDCQQEVKRFLNNSEGRSIVWQEQNNAFRLQPATTALVAGMIMLNA
jgi:hypothetical protein